MESRSRSGSNTPEAPSGGEGDTRKADVTSPNPALEDPDRILLAKACKDVLAPLVHADGGELYIVRVSSDDVHLHLAGTCSGCPGASFTRDAVITPIVRTVLPKVRVIVTTGFRIPQGAERIS